MYFSDHGLTHTPSGTGLRHSGSPMDEETINQDFKESYLVPMMKLSSDSEEHKVIKTKKSGFNFIYAFSEWLGIKEKHLNSEYCFWCEKEDENVQVLVYRKEEWGKFGVDEFNYKKIIPVNELSSDPAQLPTTSKK